MAAPLKPLRRSAVPLLLLLALCVSFPLLSFQWDLVAEAAVPRVWASLGAAWLALAVFLCTEGRSARVRAEHEGDGGALRARAASLLEGAGFKVSAGAQGALAATRGYRLSRVLWGEPEWREFPVEMTVAVKESGGRCTVEAACRCPLFFPVGRIGERLKILLRRTAEAAAALDPQALRAADDGVVFAQGSWLRFGGLSLRIQAALLGASLLTMGVLLWHGESWLRGESIFINGEGLKERLTVTRWAEFGPVERALNEQADRLRAMEAAGRLMGGARALAESLSSTAAGYPLFLGISTEGGTVRFSPVSRAGARLPLADDERFELDPSSGQGRDNFIRGCRGGLFYGLVWTFHERGAADFGAKAVVLGAFLSFSDLERSAPMMPTWGPREFTVWRLGKPILRVDWERRDGKDTVRAWRGEKPLSDDAAAAVLQYRRDALSRWPKTFFGELLMTLKPGFIGEPGLVREENRGGTFPWLAVYDMPSGAAGFHGYSLAAQYSPSLLEGEVLDHEFGLVLFVPLLLLVIVAMGVFVSNQLTLPIFEIKDALKAIADGDFSTRLEVRRKDELGQLGAVVNKLASELRRREAIKELLGKYMSSQVAEQVLKEKDEPSLAGRQREVSVLFADVRGFTTYSERHPAATVVKSLNEYFGVMVDVIASHEGVLDKYIGDGLMVVFNAPHDQPDHAKRAVVTALEMQAALQSLNLKRAQRGEEPIAIGIGVNTGQAISGRLGSVKRMEFTVVGDTVNLASRLEHHAQKGQILIGPGTFEKVNGEVDWESLGKVAVKGKQQPVDVWQVKGLRLPRADQFPG